MSANTLGLNANLETRKKLIGIAKNVGTQSLSTVLSQGSSVLSTEKEIRDTNQVNILIPFLTGFKTKADALAEVRSGGLSSSAPKLGEKVLTLANELVTDPINYVPRDGEVLQASELLSRYEDGFTTSAVVMKDSSYFRNITNQGLAGVSGAKSEFWDATKATTDKEFLELLRDGIERIYEHQDGVFQGDLSDSDLAITLSNSAYRKIRNVITYDINSNTASADTIATGKIPKGKIDDIIVYTTKRLPKGIDAVIQLRGGATSAFLFKDTMNNDKTTGLNSRVLSLEVNEGTGM